MRTVHIVLIQRIIIPQISHNAGSPWQNKSNKRTYWLPWLPLLCDEFSILYNGFFLNFKTIFKKSFSALNENLFWSTILSVCFSITLLQALFFRFFRLLALHSSGWWFCGSWICLFARSISDAQVIWHIHPAAPEWLAYSANSSFILLFLCSRQSG